MYAVQPLRATPRLPSDSASYYVHMYRLWLTTPMDSLVRRVTRSEDGYSLSNETETLASQALYLKFIYSGTDDL